MSSPSFPFLALPAEVRCVVYSYYFPEKHGYHYHHETGKLRTFSGESISLGLMYTCRTIARETRGLALQSNAIFFTTKVHTQEEMTQADRFGNAIDELHFIRWALLCRISPLVTPDIFNQFVEEHGHMGRMVRDILEYTGWNRREVIRSSKVRTADEWEAVEYLLQLVAEADPQSFDELVADIWPRDDPNTRPLPLADALKCWDIPSEADIERMESLVKSYMCRYRYNDALSGARDVYSAASMAIHFLNNLPLSTRLDIRDMILSELRTAVATPACHMRGLIPFCRENENLRIDRRVNLWNGVFDPVIYESQIVFEVIVKNVSSQAFTQHLACWLIEASDLTEAGMPHGSFLFYLDGHPSNPGTSLVFDLAIKKDLKLHLEFCRRYRQTHGREASDLEARWSKYYIHRNFRKAMRRFVWGNSFKTSFSLARLAELSL